MELPENTCSPKVFPKRGKLLCLSHLLFSGHKVINKRMRVNLRWKKKIIHYQLKAPLFLSF